MSKTQKKPLCFTHLRLQSWRNFTQVDIELPRRVFLVGPNASGKSNLLDVFRFLHDIASVGGGFQVAVAKPWRGGFAKLKSLTAPQYADIGIQVHVGNDKSPKEWEYELRFAQEHPRPKIKEERVVRKGRELLRRPHEEDNQDPYQLTQTYLEQVSVNQNFRELAEFFASVSYLHLVPQLVRHLIYAAGPEDPFGGSVLARMANLPQKERQARLRLMGDALRAAVPQLKDLDFWTDPVDKRPHLRAAYEHLPGTWQLEDQFSDGTLRLIGQLWALLDGNGPLLLEEPELSLHPGVIRYLPYLFLRMQQRTGRQVIISTHAAELLRDEGIGLNEVILLQPGRDGSTAQPAGDAQQVRALVEGGLDLGEATLPETAPQGAHGLTMVGK